MTDAPQTSSPSGSAAAAPANAATQPAAPTPEMPTDVILAPPEVPSKSTPAQPPIGNSNTSIHIEVAPRPVTPVPLAWRSWPVVDSLGEFILLTTAIVGAPAIVFQSAGPAYALFAFVAVLFVSWRSFVPTVFELSALGVTESRLGRTRRIPWISIDRYLIGRRGVFLSSTGAPLEMLRGLYLPWSQHRDQILTTLRYYLPRAED
jgi:hypothetical protein